MNDREQIINFLLQSGDSKDRIIETLKAQIAELQKPATKATGTK